MKGGKGKRRTGEKTFEEKGNKDKYSREGQGKRKG